MTVPDWWAAALLGMASFRVYRLIAKDTLLDAPRRWLVGLGKWGQGKPVPSSYREGLVEFLLCAWCLGFWITLAWWGAWQAWPHGTLVAAAPFAISAGVGLIAQLDKEDE